MDESQLGRIQHYEELFNTILNDLAQVHNIQYDQEDSYEAFSRYYFEPLITVNFIYDELVKLDSSRQQRLTKELTDQCQKIYRLFQKLKKKDPNFSIDSPVLSPDTAHLLESTSKILERLPNVTQKEKKVLEKKIPRIQRKV